MVRVRAVEAAAVEAGLRAVVVGRRGRGRLEAAATTAREARGVRAWPEGVVRLVKSPAAAGPEAVSAVEAEPRVVVWRRASAISAWGVVRLGAGWLNELCKLPGEVGVLAGELRESG